MIKVQITGEPKGHGKFIWAVQDPPLGGLSRQPLLDACRALSAAGVPDNQYAGLYRGDKLSMTCQVGYGRKWLVFEPSSGTIRLARWRPRPYSDFASGS
jgi:hypothetical protein